MHPCIGRLAPLTASVLMACLLSPTAASAREKGVRAYAGGRVGYLHVQDVDEGALNVGLMGGGYLSPHLALGGSMDWHRSDYDPQKRETYALTASLEVFVLSYRYIVQPYVVGGLGYYQSAIIFKDEFGNEVGSTKHEKDFGYHAGAGMDINVSRDEDNRIALNIEARWIFTKPSPDGEDVEPDGAQITVGLRIKGR